MRLILVSDDACVRRSWRAATVIRCRAWDTLYRWLCERRKLRTIMWLVRVSHFACLSRCGAGCQASSGARHDLRHRRDRQTVRRAPRGGRSLGSGEFLRRGRALSGRAIEVSHALRHAEQFVGRPSIADLIAKSSFVISHGGTGSVIELLRARKRFVAFANPRLADNHQAAFLRQMTIVADISWSRNVTDLARLYQERVRCGPATLKADFPRADDIVRELGARQKRLVSGISLGPLSRLFSRGRPCVSSATKAD